MQRTVADRSVKRRRRYAPTHAAAIHDLKYEPPAQGKAVSMFG